MVAKPDFLVGVRESCISVYAFAAISRYGSALHCGRQLFTNYIQDDNLLLANLDVSDNPSWSRRNNNDKGVLVGFRKRFSQFCK